jgi:hypothetical protein
LYATYTWTAAPGLSTLQAARFYVPALGAISLLGAWLLVRVPRRQPFVAVTTLVVVAALFGLGGWAFHDMYQFPFGSQLVVVPGPGGTVELKPGPGAMIGSVDSRTALRPTASRISTTGLFRVRVTVSARQHRCPCDLGICALRASRLPAVSCT